MRSALPVLNLAEAKFECIFNQGCVLHKVGATEGDKYRYKPAACSLFPLAKTEEGEWYVRQHGYQDDDWDLFCLSPTASTTPATESIQEEMQLGARYDAETAAELKRHTP